MANEISASVSSASQRYDALQMMVSCQSEMRVLCDLLIQLSIIAMLVAPLPLFIEEMGSVFSWCGDMLERTLCQLTRHPPALAFMDIVIQESGIDDAFNPMIWASLNMGKAQHPIQDARLYWTQNDGASWIGPMLHPPQNNFDDVFLIGRCYQLIKDINLHCDCCLGSIQFSSGPCFPLIQSPKYLSVHPKEGGWWYFGFLVDSAIEWKAKA